MTFWARYRRALWIVAITTVADIAGRVVLQFEMVQVSALESVLFSAGAGAFLWAARRDGHDHRVRKIDFVLAALFGLAALRAMIWATTGHVFAANLAVLTAGALLVAALWLRRRRRPDRAA